MSRLSIEIEKKVRDLLNIQFSRNAVKQALKMGSKGARHEFDLYEDGEVVGGISTSPWYNRTKKRTANTGGRDRVAAELLWLTLWPGKERRFHILTDQEMAEKIYSRFQGCPFPHEVGIMHCDLERGSFTTIGILGST